MSDGDKQPGCSGNSSSAFSGTPRVGPAPPRLLEPPKIRKPPAPSHSEGFRLGTHPFTKYLQVPRLYGALKQATDSRQATTQLPVRTVQPLPAYMEFPEGARGSHHDGPASPQPQHPQTG